MRFGYPCINRSIGCTANSTFRLDSYSEERMIKTIQKNIFSLKKTLEWNVAHNILFFRIGSSFIPFASHPVCTFAWKLYFAEELRQLGVFIKKHGMRISMHPDQFVLINAQNPLIVEKSIAELVYHAELLDSFELNIDAKIQIHVGGVYGNKKTAIDCFLKNYPYLSPFVQRRLVVEHDHNRFSFQDCFEIHQKITIPIVVDTLHHECLNNGESLRTIMEKAQTTWQEKDGPLMIDYSSQKIDAVKGAHAESMNELHFLLFLKEVKGIRFDCMFEIKDKEQSALRALKLLSEKIEV